MKFSSFYEFKKIIVAAETIWGNKGIQILSEWVYNAKPFQYHHMRIGSNPTFCLVSRVNPNPRNRLKPSSKLMVAHHILRNFEIRFGGR